MKVKMKTGQAVKGSAKGGRKPVYLYHDVEIIRDTAEMGRFMKAKYLPHNGERKAAREMARHK